jgi:Tat protein translocase TatB subunit
VPQVGPLEILVVAVIALIVFGPEKLPDLARRVGRTAAELRRLADEAREEFQVEFDLGAEEDDEIDGFDATDGADETDDFDPAQGAGEIDGFEVAEGAGEDGLAEGAEPPASAPVPSSAQAPPRKDASEDEG